MRAFTWALCLFLAATWPSRAGYLDWFAAGGQATAGVGVKTSALTDGSSIAVDASKSIGFTLTLTGAAHTIANPTNQNITGQPLNFFILQNATGGFTPTWDTDYYFPAGVSVSTAANSGTIVSCEVVTPNSANGIWCVSANPISVSLPTRQVFTSGSSATYTTPNGAALLVVTECGGGGGGGGVGGTTGATGTSGGNTTFNSITANGGTGGGGATGTTAGTGGAGGTGGSGTATYRVAGTAGITPSAGALVGVPGGMGGVAACVGSRGLGGLGGGAPTTSRAPGGGGGGGETAVIFITSPASSYTYTVGGPGAGGTATGTSANAGQTGFGGYIEVDEYYGFTGNGSAPTMGTCGSGPSVTGHDTAWTITTGSGTVTSCTLNFSASAPWGTSVPSACVVSDSSTSITPDISALSATAVTVSFSATLTSGKIYGICQP